MKPVGQKTVVDIGPSRSLGLFFCSIYLIALIVVIGVSLRYPLCFALIPVLLWNWIRGWSMHVALTDRSAVARVEWGRDDAWTLLERQGRQTSARLMERNFVAPWMTLLSFSGRIGFRRHVILLGDNCDADQLRRLRVRLRMNRSTT